MRNNKNILFRSIAVLSVTALLGGCYASSGRENHSDGETGDAADTHDSPPADIYPDAERQCMTDDDCAIVLNQDRCCRPDPGAVPRALLGSNPCYHELGRPWVDDPDCPFVECMHCVSIDQPAYAARCEAGRCVPVTDFCAPMTAPAPAASLWANVTPQGGWEQYRGQVIQVRGAPRFGFDTCECCTVCDCTCFDNPVQQTLECAVSLRGSLCGLEYSCSGTECNADCSPRELQNSQAFTGYLVDSAAGGLELWITSNDNDCPPAGLNPEGAPCTPMADDDCAEGLFCFFWGDVLDDCTGECRPMGTECMYNTDCNEGDICFMGYCMWCCPG